MGTKNFKVLTKKEKHSPERKLATETSQPKSCCSNIKKIEKDLYVDLPEDAKARKPVPRAKPRKSLSTLNLTSTNHLSLYVDDTSNAMQQYSESLTSQSSTSDDERKPKKNSNTSSITYSKQTKKQTKSNYYPTVPHRKVNSRSSSATTSKDDTQLSEFKKMTLYRVAPAPPLASKPKKKLSDQQNTAKPKYLSPKKAKAPLPPTISSNVGMLKAEVLKVFEISKKRSIDFYPTLQGVTATINHIIVLDADDQQVVLFNTEGFYESRFQVHIPNQGKLHYLLLILILCQVYAIVNRHLHLSSTNTQRISWKFSIYMSFTRSQECNVLDSTSIKLVAIQSLTECSYQLNYSTKNIII